ncbi:uncharacterized protein N7446_000282 [Penicillium canescens]|uniref:Cytochrome P450 n=1 Tax=Penicillium canescens TaxID=5083 RepID=A0AAD6N5N7_PENCN|nr:uncharacterized protein N7446_000282 [Penicillium canescens]KAJ6030655.1 hypothetical protein N7460_010921 [Penicillium canescens]KAJ6059629.1 hypothetical protein N7444_003268 [Penicillium canescens]KAJ6077346.1 hypothetical protein N7446_000282 [Penicillium canescens]
MKEYQAYFYAVCLCTLFYIGTVLFYRLVLSPLAKFPGPRLAAATHLYETYFQIIKGGTFTWHINDLHKQYGPVVRISPWEIHIKDPDYYNTVYAGPGKLRNKDPLFSCIRYPKSIFSHKSYRPWRRLLGHFLEKGAILELEPVVKANTLSLCKHFAAAVKSNEALELYTAFHCYTSDTLSQHAFGHDLGFHYLDEPQLANNWKTKVNSMFQLSRLFRHFNFEGDIAHLIPRPLALAVPQYALFYSVEQDVKLRVQQLIDQYDQWEVEAQSTSHAAERPFLKTSNAIYPAILANPDVPLLEKSHSLLEDDAIFLMHAGTDAPSQTIAMTMFQILNNPTTYQRLKEELFTAIPDVTATPNMDRLEQMPYLTATIREGLRLASVVTTRPPCSAPDEVLRYRQWDIPAGTFISMSTYFILRDPEIFPEPDKFLPERWLLEPEELRKLEKYLVPASKGILGCLGQQYVSPMAEA